jgi:threonine/homoserine/homoserine lactone efflux protein
LDQLSAFIPPSIWAFALASLLIELTPGPNMTYLAIVSASKGRGAGFATVAGVALGLATLGIVGAVGVAAMVQASQPLYQALRWAGVIYLLWLAFDGWRGENDGFSDGFDSRHFVRGFVTNLLNPKAALFYVTVLPQFLDPLRPLLAQTLVMSAVYVAVATLVHGVIVVLAGSLRPFLTAPRKEMIVRRTLSLFLALVALWFAWSTAR